jgi:hypothetical protein
MKKYTSFLLLFAVTIFYSCDDFIEKDLQNESINIITPANNSKISSSTVTFWWDKVEGALEYNVQVVSPSFDQVQRLWADSIVSGNKIMFSLVPGNFEWRVNAVNGSSGTEFAAASFSIDSTINLINETIILTSPKNNIATNNTNQTFRWNNIYNANEYHFIIANSAGDFLKDEIMTKTETSFEFTADGIYTWSVRGQNEMSNTIFSKSSLQIDTKAPGQPTLNMPSDKAIIPAEENVSFSWSRAADNGSQLFDSLYVFADEAMTNRVLAEKTEQTSHKALIPDAGTYYWYVKTCDVAGNVGGRPTKEFSFVKN